MEKKRRETYRRLIALMLTVVFIIPLAAKAIHVGFVPDDETEVFDSGLCQQHNPVHQSHSCPVCQFTFSVFEAGDVIQLSEPVVSVHHIFTSLLVTNVIQKFADTHLLRAPPTVLWG